MLELILGKDWTVNRREVLSRVAAQVQQRHSGQIILVPELISHDTERRLCESAGDTASRYAEVLSFTRLVRRVSDWTGIAVEPCLDNGGRVVAMACATKQLSSRLKAYAAVETKPEFLTELVDAVDEFKRCCITAQDLSAASRRSQGSLAEKLQELSMLLEAYDAICAQSKRDPRDLHTWLLEQLEDSDYAEQHEFYIDGFPDFTRQNLLILEHLITHSPKVVVSLNCDCVDSKTLAFEKAGETAAQILRCAQRENIPYSITVLPEDPRESVRIAGCLFQGRPEQPFENLTAIRAESVHQEIEAAAEEVLSRIRNGCRYRDISLVCADVSYENIVRMVFTRCGIPVYRSGTEDILCKNVIVTVLAALEAAFGGFEQKAVLRFMKSVLSLVSMEEGDLLENYVILWGITGSRWTTKWVYHPRELGGKWTDDADKELAQLNTLRSLLITPLEHLQHRFRSAKNLAGQVEAIYDFLEEIQLAQKLDDLAKTMDAQGDNRSAQILNQLWEILLTAMEQLYDTLGQTVWEAEVFTRLFVLLLSQYDVGTIPPVLDAVMVGPVTAMRCQEPKHLLVLGAAEGCLPGYNGSSGVLTDQERVALRQLGVPLTGGAIDGIQAEFAEIYGLFCGSENSVWISCSAAQPSYLFNRLAQFSGGEQTAGPQLGAALGDPWEAGAYLARFNASREADSLGLSGSYRQALSLRSYDLGEISRENIQTLYGKRLRLSASQIDCQADCRLSYFLKYGLRAKERKEATIDAAQFGTYVHDVLENTAKAVMELGGFHQVSLEKTMELAQFYSQEYTATQFKDIDSRRIQYLFQRNGQELEMVVRELWEELSRSAFVPVDFETAFGFDGGLDAVHFSGELMEGQLSGFVDRVDAWQELGQNYFRVVDYKTGKKSFDYCDVFNGLGLQMLLYLFALEQQGQSILGQNPVPAGVQYFPARAPLVTADGSVTQAEAEKLRDKEWKRKGLLLADDEVLKAMEPEGAPPRLCCKWNKDGVLSGDIADRQQLKQLKTYIFRQLGKMVDDIGSGNVKPNPYTRGTSHNACTYCPFGSVCGKGQLGTRRNYKAMSAQRFWEEIRKELDDHG